MGGFKDDAAIHLRKGKCNLPREKKYVNRYKPKHGNHYSNTIPERKKSVNSVARNCVR